MPQTAAEPVRTRARRRFDALFCDAASRRRAIFRLSLWRHGYYNSPRIFDPYPCLYRDQAEEPCPRSAIPRPDPTAVRRGWRDALGPARARRRRARHYRSRSEREGTHLRLQLLPPYTPTSTLPAAHGGRSPGVTRGGRIRSYCAGTPGDVARATRRRRAGGHIATSPRWARCSASGRTISGTRRTRGTAAT